MKKTKKYLKNKFNWGTFLVPSLIITLLKSIMENDRVFVGNEAKQQVEFYVGMEPISKRLMEKIVVLD